MWMEFTADICCCLVFFWFGLVWFGLVQLAVPGCSWGGQFPNVLQGGCLLACTVFAMTS
jgi:hypothetical protein